MSTLFFNFFILHFSNPITSSTLDFKFLSRSKTLLNFSLCRILLVACENHLKEKICICSISITQQEDSCYGT